MKRAVALGGGGSRGGYEIGVWKALRELDYDFDIVTGTSVGALNAAVMVQDIYDEAVELWENIDNTYVYLNASNIDLSSIIGTFSTIGAFINEMFNKGGADYTPLKKLIEKSIDEEKIRKSNIELGIITVEFPSFRPRAVFLDQIPKGALCDYLLASAACFPAMQGYKIGEKIFIDGGYYDNIPIKLAYDKGARDIVAVDLEGIGIHRAFNPNDAKIRYIRPMSPLGQMLLFDREISKRNVQYGYLDTLKAFDAADGSLFTFKSGDSVRNFNLLADIMIELLDRIGFLNEKSAEYKIFLHAKRAVSSYYRVRPDAIRMFCCCGESLGEAFGMAYDRIHDINEYNKELFDRINSFGGKQSSAGPENAVNKLLDGLHNSIFEMKELSLPFDRKNTILYIAQTINEYIIKKENPVKINLLAGAAPLDFAAALYILTLNGAFAKQNPSHNKD